MNVSKQPFKKSALFNCNFCNQLLNVTTRYDNNKSTRPCPSCGEAVSLLPKAAVNCDLFPRDFLWLSGPYFTIISRMSNRSSMMSALLSWWSVILSSSISPKKIGKTSEACSMFFSCSPTYWSWRLPIKITQPNNNVSMSKWWHVMLAHRQRLMRWQQERLHHLYLTRGAYGGTSKAAIMEMQPHQRAINRCEKYVPPSGCLPCHISAADDTSAKSSLPIWQRKSTAAHWI